MKLIKIKTYNITYLGGNIYRIDGTEDIYLNPDYIVTIEKLHLNIPNNDYAKDNKKELYLVKLLNKESIKIDKDTLGEILNNTDNNRMVYIDKDN